MADATTIAAQIKSNLDSSFGGGFSDERQELAEAIATPLVQLGGIPGEKGDQGDPGIPGAPGAPGIAALLTNDSHVLPADKDGNVSSFAGATTEIRIFLGDADDSANWTITKGDSAGVTSTLSGRVVTVTAMTVDTGYVDIGASKAGYPLIVRRFSLAKSRAGATGPEGNPGNDALTAYLTNEAAVITCDQYGNAPGGTLALTQMVVLRGATEESGSWSFEVAPPSNANGVTWSLSGNLLTITGFSNQIDNGELTVTATRASNPTLTRKYRLAKSKTGATGSQGPQGNAGANAQTLSLVATGQSFTYDGTGAASPPSQTITFDAVPQNVAGTATFTCTLYDVSGASLGTVTLGGSGNTGRTLTNAQFASLGAAVRATVVATLSGLTDRVTVVKLQNGATGATGGQGVPGPGAVNPVTVLLTNEAQLIGTAPDGSGGNYGGATTDVLVYLGTTNDTAQWDLVATPSAGVTLGTVDQALHRVPVTAMSVDSGYVDIMARRNAKSPFMGNLLRNSDFSVGTGSIADGFAVYNNSAGTEPTTLTIQASGGVNGGRLQRVTWAVLNTTTKGICTNNGLTVNGKTGGVLGGWQPNTTYIVSFYAKASGSVIGQPMSFGWNHAPTVTWISNPALTASWQRYVAKLTWDADVDTTSNGGSLWLTVPWGASCAGDLDFDCLMLEESAPVASAYAAMVESVTKRFSLAKSKTGATGAQGPQGPQGNTGTAGARGSLEFYVDMGSGAPGPAPDYGWTDTAANTAVTSSPASGGVKMLGDVVTEYSTTAATKWARTKFWGGSSWVAVDVRYNGNLLVDGTVGAAAVVADDAMFNKIATGRLKTTNYAEDGSGNPTAGAKLDSAGTAIKTYSSGLQVGTKIFSDYWFRLLQAIDGALSSTGNGNDIVWYRGNNDYTVNGGAPIIYDATNGDRLSIYPRPCLWDSGTTLFLLNFDLVVQPKTNQDNLDALRYLEIELWNTTSYRLVPYDYSTAIYAPDSYAVKYLPIVDRLYRDKIAPGSSNNATRISLSTSIISPNAGYPRTVPASSNFPYHFTGYIRAKLWNVYGVSRARDFSPTNVAGAACAISDLSLGGSPPPPASGGGGGGGGCPAPWVKVQSADGRWIHASDVRNGMLLAGINDMDMQPKVGRVAEVQTIWAERVAILLSDGTAPEFSMKHRLYTVDRGLVNVETLRSGDQLMAQRPLTVAGVTKAGRGQVISFQVEGTGTYFTDGILSHNMKNIN